MPYNLHKDQIANTPAALKKELQAVASFHDLLNVGAEKLVGYLPLSTIREDGGHKADLKIMQWAKETGLSCKKIKNGQTDSGALYVWHNDFLAMFLKKYSAVFENAEIPTTPEKYIDYIEHFTVSLNTSPNAYILIAKTFNDPRFK